jgi:hypothetical protein
MTVGHRDRDLELNLIFIILLRRHTAQTGIGQSESLLWALHCLLHLVWANVLHANNESRVNIGGSNHPQLKITASHIRPDFQPICNQIATFASRLFLQIPFHD